MRHQILLILMPVLSLLGCQQKGVPFPHQSGDYTISSMDSLIEQQYQIRPLELEPDYSGEVIATLLRHDAPDSSRRAVLYIHGYGDYFFHDHLRNWYNEQGYNFYALDLRKHGRSLLPHQKACYVKDLNEYFEEISQAIQIIKQTDGNNRLIVQAHSTGGLTASLYADRGNEKEQIDALLLNSPFFAFQASGAEKKIMNLYASWSRWRPNVALPVEFEGFYGQSLHTQHEGTWEYTLAWKPVKGHPLYGAWIRAINRGHRELYAGLDIPRPILLMRSDKSTTATELSDDIFESDIVLDVEDMLTYSDRLGSQVEVVTIDNAVHDIFLSKPSVREAAFRSIEQWLAKTEL